MSTRSAPSPTSTEVLPLFRPRRSGPLAPLARAVSSHRRKLAILAAVSAVLCTIAAASPSKPPTVPVVVAAHTLSGGHALSAADLRIAHYPMSLAPADTHADPVELTGRVLIAGVGSGTPVGPGAVVAPRELAPGVGRSLVPLRLDDPAVAGLLQVGDHIDVLATSSGESPTRTIATGARVLAFPGTDTSEGPLGMSSGPSGRLVLLEVSPTEATELVTAQSRDHLAVVLR
mgnify:CR=1 FL=1